MLCLSLIFKANTELHTVNTLNFFKYLFTPDAQVFQWFYCISSSIAYNLYIILCFKVYIRNREIKKNIWKETYVLK